MSIQLNGTGHVGTPHQLLCQIDTAGSTVPYGSLTYQWTSTCSRECFILTQSTVASVSTQYIKAVDSGTHTCTVTDSVGNRGNTSVRISTTGKKSQYCMEIGPGAPNYILSAHNSQFELFDATH